MKKLLKKIVEKLVYYILYIFIRPIKFTNEDYQRILKQKELEKTVENN